MAFFKFRKQGDESSPAPSQPESIETMRKRAKYRLIGAAVLVLAGVIGFPLMFDQQPRPIAVDLPIDIPDRNKVAPLTIPAPVTAAAVPDKSDVLSSTSPNAAVPARASEFGTSRPKAPNLPVEKALDAPAAPEAKPAEKSVDPVQPVPRTAVAVDEGAKARSLLEGQDPVRAKAVPEAAGRYVVQVGAFADALRAREVRQKMERAGLKTYTHVAETKDGPRIRVRVGPFDSKVEADAAAEKIKKLDLPAATLTL